MQHDVLATFERVREPLMLRIPDDEKASAQNLLHLPSRHMISALEQDV